MDKRAVIVDVFLLRKTGFCISLSHYSMFYVVCELCLNSHTIIHQWVVEHKGRKKQELYPYTALCHSHFVSFLVFVSSNAQIAERRA